MYFFKFMKWFCVDYLNDAFERFIAGALTWGFGALVSLGIGALLHKIDLVMSIYIFGSMGIAGIVVVIVTFFFMRERYREWQDQVFDKLKEDPKNRTDW